MTNSATVAATLRINPDFVPDDRNSLVEVLSSGLDQRLVRYSEDQVEMEISVKGRGGDQQRVTFEVWIAVSGNSRFVATSSERELGAAITEVRDDMRRQINRFVTRREDSRNGKRQSRRR